MTINSVLKPLVRRFGRGHQYHDKKALYELLVNHTLLSPADLERAESIADQDGVDLNSAILDGGFLSESDLRVFLALESHLPVQDVSQVASQPQALGALSLGGALAYKVLPLSVQGNILIVATEYPLHRSVKGLEWLTGLQIQEVLSLRGSIRDQILSRYLPNRETNASHLAEVGIEIAPSKVTKKKRSTTKRRNKGQSKATSGRSKVNVTEKPSSPIS